jgi:DNA repair protein RecO (recombination protein O)
MALLSTDAIVLHAFDYLESSRILRLATREGGVRSVLARGARRSTRRFGSALDLFAEGVAEIHTRPGRELDTLGAFDVQRARTHLAADLGRFLGASAIAELMLRFSRESADPELYAALVRTLDDLGAADPAHASEAALAGAWRVVSALGFGPAVESCAQCHAPLADDEVTMFSHPIGGTLCRRCSRLAVAGRVLPPPARLALVAWMSGGRVSLADASSVRAHQRLLREFLSEHLADERPLRAFAAWERDAWGDPDAAEVPSR